jgi:hypothetical protein
MPDGMKLELIEAETVPSRGTKPRSTDGLTAR